MITSNADANDNFKAYYLDATTITTGITIAIPVSVHAAAPYTAVKIKLLDSSFTATDSILVLYLEGGVAKEIYSITTPIPAFTTPGAPVAGTTVGTSTFPLAASYVGTNNLWVNKDDGNSWIRVGAAFAAAAPANLGAAGYTYVGYSLANAVSVIGSYHATTDGNVASAIGTTSRTPQVLTAAFAYRSFSDNIRNVIFVGSAVGAALNWVTFSDLATPVATEFYIAATTVNHALFNSAVSIAFANHRAFLLQASQISIAELDSASSDIKLIKTVASLTALADLTVQTEVVLNSRCMTTSVARHTCFATTLNCIVTVKSVVGTKTPESPAAV